MARTAPLPDPVRWFLEDLTRRLQQHAGNNLVEVRLFGSHAHGEARPDSDVDVLVVVEQLPLPVKDRILEIMADTALDYEMPIGLLVWDRNRWHQHEALETLLIRHSEGVVLWRHP